MFPKNKTFITVDNAQKAVVENTRSGKSKTIYLHNAIGHVLSKSLKSLINSPPFSNSAMDGYAFKFNDFVKGEAIRIVGESSAGRSFQKSIKPGEAVRIFTGAEVPKGADTVVMQEKVSVDSNKLIVHDNLLKKGANIRLAGSQNKKNDLVLPKGSYLNPGSVGYLASLGIDKVNVYQKPKVSIIITGNELIPVGKTLKMGQIYESNAPTLKAALTNEGISMVQVVHIKDSLNATKKAFKKLLGKSDFILFTGGISAGDYDFVGEVMKQEKVKTIFYKVKQKPGKPLYFGVRKSSHIFGLPGNPAAVLTCFYEYVLPALRKFQNRTPCYMSEFLLPLSQSINKKPGLTHFLKAHTDFKSVLPLGGQESYIMSSFAKANCFIILNEDVTELKRNALVKIHYFGNGY